MRRARRTATLVLVAVACTKAVRAQEAAWTMARPLNIGHQDNARTTAAVVAEGQPYCIQITDPDLDGALSGGLSWAGETVHQTPCKPWAQGKFYREDMTSAWHNARKTSHIVLVDQKWRLTKNPAEMGANRGYVAGEAGVGCETSSVAPHQASPLGCMFSGACLVTVCDDATMEGGAEQPSWRTERSGPRRGFDLQQEPLGERAGQEEHIDAWGLRHSQSPTEEELRFPALYQMRGGKWPVTGKHKSSLVLEDQPQDEFEFPEEEDEDEEKDD